MVSNYMTIIFELTFSIPGVTKIAIHQKLIDQLGPNFRIGSFNECYTFVDK